MMKLKWFLSHHMLVSGHWRAREEEENSENESTLCNMSRKSVSSTIGQYNEQGWIRLSRAVRAADVLYDIELAL